MIENKPDYQEMKNLSRALRMTLKYRWSLLTSFLCSVLVAGLWSLNLGAVYPFVEVIMRGHSLHDWAAGQQLEADSRIDLLKKEIAVLQVEHEKLIDPAEKSVLFQKINGLKFDIDAQHAKLTTLDRLLPWIQRWAPRDPFGTLMGLMILLFVGTVLRGIFLIGSMVSVARVGQRTMLDLQNQVFQNILSMEPSELNVKGTGDLISRLRGETGMIGQAITALFGKTVREPLKMIGCLTGAAIVNWRLLLLSVVVCPVAAFLMLKLAKITKRANRKAMEESAKLLNRLYQALVFHRTVRAYNMESTELARFQSVAQDIYKRSMRISWLGALARMNTELFGVTMLTLSVLAGAYMVLNHQTHLFGVRMCAAPMTFGSMMMFFGFLIGIVDPLRKMGDVFQLIQSGMVAADRVFPLLDQTPMVRNPTEPQKLPHGPLSIEFENVHFEYDPATPVLQGVNAKIPAGASVAILGQNGSGKTTLVNMIPRFFDPKINGDSFKAGRIKIAGIDIRNVPITQLRDRIGYVSQTTMLFGDTLAANIAYGNETATKNQIMVAAQKAHAAEFIELLDDGYDTDLGEREGLLSGGQRQRISLARSILKDPDILILDESTSQIDPESKDLIHASLADFMQGRTTIIITHHLSTLSLVDLIMLMKDGKVVDLGTHEELLLRCEEYQRLRNSEFAEAA